ncbi:unnamed protein product [Closterium sp. Naga37s-1]|nr:unnamed protein product [Closterium sp. Naga37s-1]
MSPQAPDSLVKLSRSSSATLCGRSQHGCQQHCELVRRVQTSLTRTVTECLMRDHGEGRVSNHLYQLQRVKTLRKAVELAERRLGNTCLRRLECLSQEQTRLIGSNVMRILSRRRATTRGHKFHTRNRRNRRQMKTRSTSSCRGSCCCEQASETAAGSAVESRAGDETTCTPGEPRGNGGETGGGQVTGGVRADLPGPSASQQARTDPPLRAQPTEPGRQWWRTPPSVTKQKPEQARRGQKRAVQRGRQGPEQGDQHHPQQEQMPTAQQGEPGDQELQPERTEQQQGQTGQPLARQGDPQAATRSGDGAGAPAITISGAGKPQG